MFGEGAEHSRRGACAPHFRPGANLHVALLGELERVADHVEQHLPQPDFIEQQSMRQLGIDLAEQPHALLAGFNRKKSLDFLDQSGDGDRFILQFELACFDLGQIENVVDEREQGPAAGADGVEVLAFPRRRHLRAQQFGEAEDGVHRRANLVRHVRQKLALGRIGRLGGTPRFLG